MGSRVDTSIFPAKSLMDLFLLSPKTKQQQQQQQQQEQKASASNTNNSSDIPDTLPNKSKRKMKLIQYLAAFNAVALLTVNAGEFVRILESEDAIDL